MNDEDAFDRALRLATADPGLRPAFYQQLLQSNALVILSRSSSEGSTIPAGELIDVEQWMREDGERVIPFFSSEAALFRALPEGAPCAVVAVRELFEMCVGRSLQLNPDSDCTMVLRAATTAALLASGSVVTSIAVCEGANHTVEISAVTEAPSALIGALTSLYARLPNVVSARLACVREITPPHNRWLVVGLQLAGNETREVRDTLAVAGECYRGSLRLTVYLIDVAEGSFPTQLLEIEPFYERAWGQHLDPSLRGAA